MKGEFMPGKRSQPPAETGPARHKRAQHRETEGEATLSPGKSEKKTPSSKENEEKLNMVQENLTPPEEAALRQIARPALLTKAISEEVRDRLIELGYVQQKLSGLIATPKGNFYLLLRQKK